MGKRGGWGAPSSPPSIPLSQLWECLEPIPTLPNRRSQGYKSKPHKNSRTFRAVIQEPPKNTTKERNLECAKGIRGIFHDGKLMDAPTSPGTSSRFSLRAFDLRQKSTFCFSALPGHKKRDFGKDSPFPVDQLWQGTEGGTQRCPQIPLSPSPAIPFPPKQGCPGVGKNPSWSSPTIPQLGNPGNCRGHEVFQLFQPSPGPPWNRGKIIIPSY